MNKFFKLLGCTVISSALILMSGCVEDDEDNNSQKFSSAVASTSQKQFKTIGKFPNFTTTDLNGKQVTNDIFAQKKLTVINIWGTFCGPCINEMPELGEWSDEMSNNVQLIGLVCDIEGADDYSTINDAKAILNDANANFLNIIPNGGLSQYLNNVDAVPTTIFVDSEGNILDKTISGADVDGYIEVVAEYLNE